MLLGHDTTQPLYVIGKGISVEELAQWIQETESIEVRLISTEDFLELPDNSQGIIGFWNFDYRKEFIGNAQKLKRRWPTYIHPRSFVSDHLSIGSGTVILPMAMLGYKVRIGDFCVIGGSCSIGHGTQLANNVVMTQGTVIGGSTIIDQNVWIGQNSSVKDKISICANIEFAMSSVVSKNIEVSGKYVGNKKVG